MNTQLSPTNHGCVVVMDAPYGKSHCATCGREWEACTPQGSANHCVRELGSQVASLKEQLANAQSEAKFCREHLEREREKLAEIEKDARAIRAYYATAHTMGFINAPFWHELADETKQLYRDHVARSPQLPGGEKP
jgi:hypothetical protein